MNSLAFRSLRIGPFSFIIRPRLCLTVIGCVFAAAIITVLSLSLGDYHLSPAQIVNIIAGGGTSLERTVVFQWRMGRAVLALVIGLALGFAGALTQTVARNPLASPDVLGVTNGASLAVVISLVGLGGGKNIAHAMNAWGLPTIAMSGGIITSIVVMLLAGKRGRANMVQFVLIGVGVSTFLSACTTWALAHTDLDTAAGAKLWLTGSLNGRDWSNLPLPLIIIILALMCAGYLSFILSALALGPEIATILGHRVTINQLTQLVVGIILTAVAVSAAGPIGFIAFVSPQIAMRLAGSSTPPLICSACVGAVAVSGADLIARIILPWELPVGIVTALCGAPVLLYLIINLNRKATI